MNSAFKDPEMESLLDHFIRSCFPSNYAEFTWGVELGELRQLKGPYLEAGKKAILDGLVKEPKSNPISAALEIKLVEAIPILQYWLREIKSDMTKRREWSKTQGQLAYVLYEFTNDETYLDDLIDAVTNSRYGEFDNTVYWLGKVPLRMNGISAVWEKYKTGKMHQNLDSWRDQCIDFLREKIKQPIGESFVNNLSADERKELFALIAETRQERIERNLRMDKYIRARDRYTSEDLNSYDEYVRIGGSPINGLTLKSIWRGHTNIVNSLAWSPDGRHLASTSEDESILIWNFEEGDCEKILIREKKFHYSEFRPKEVLWTNDGRNLAVVYDYYSVPEEDLHDIAVWDLETEKLLSSVQQKSQNKGNINNLVRMPDDKRLLVSYYGHHANALFLVDPLKGIKDLIFDLDDGILEKILLSPDGKTIAAGYRQLETSNNTQYGILLLELASGNVLGRLSGHAGPVNDLCWLPQRSLFITASSDTTIGIWDLERNQRIHLLEGHRGNVGGLSLSADGRILASKSRDDHTVYLWNTETWKLLSVLRELDGYGETIAFHPTLPVLVTICKDVPLEKASRHDVNSIRVWEFDAKKFLANPPFWQGFKG